MSGVAAAPGGRTMFLPSVRLAMVGTLVLATFLLAQLVGVAAAAGYQNADSQNAQAAITNAGRAFDIQVQRTLADGTPKGVIDPIAVQESRLRAAALPGATFFIDQAMLTALHKRASDIQGLTSRVAAVESQTEAQLHQQLMDSIQKLRDLATPAAGAGVDPAPYNKFADDTALANQGMAIPVATQKVIDAVNAKAAELQALTAQKIAANQALSSAKSDAASALSSAQAALAQAKAIPVLQVDSNATAINADATRYAQAASLADFQSVASDLWSQNKTIRNLLSTRQSAYDLLATTQDHLNRAAAAGKDVAADKAQLDPLGPQLDAAGDVNSITAVKNQIQAIKNDVDSKYWLAVYGTGKVIVVSLAKEELMALQDGVVVLDTPVTTGRPSMATITGTYHVFAKFSPYCMSSWRGNPYPWAGCVAMQYAMEWEASGYFLHDAPWRSRYGPGTNTEANGTHGCINVPRNASQMDFLYSWTPIGTTVVVLPGDFGS